MQSYTFWIWSIISCMIYDCWFVVFPITLMPFHASRFHVIFEAILFFSCVLSIWKHILKGISWWKTSEESARISFLVRAILHWILHSIVISMVCEIVIFCITKILSVIQPVVLYDKGQHYLNSKKVFRDSLPPMVNSKQNCHHHF